MKLVYFFIFLFCFSFVSSLEISQWDKIQPSGNITNEYINNTYINQTLELNSTQFETGEPATIKTSWLTQIIEGVSKWANYYTITEIDNRYSNNTGDQNLSTYVQGNMSSETTTTYTPTTNYSLSFDGSNDYVDMGTSLYDLGIRRNGTISLWMKPSAGTSGSGAISDFADSGGANYNGFNIRYESTGNVLTFYVYPNNYRITVKDAGELNVWQHVVGVLDYDFLRLYKNGVEIGNTSLGGDIGDSVATMKISARGDLAEYQSGSIDEVLIFNRSLNSTEISQLYNSGIGLYANTSISPFNDGLVSGWHFDEGTGTTAIDVTGRNNGTLVNGPSWVDGKVPHNIATQVLGAIGLMPWVSATNFISTDFSLQWIGDALKNPWNTISTLGNSTNRWNVHLNNVTMNGTQGWSGNCVNSSILNGIIVGCND